jgi:putative PEP-CTERM system histidine kinase
MVSETNAWALVPLVHLDRLLGVILLSRPPFDRALDWEDFDLLRIAGRQVASYLAEARAQEALSDAQRFDEFNRRFAFIMHDIKNLVSQLTLVARNAERHAENPEFRADMIATLQDSAGRMNDLLARLSQHNTGRPEELRAIELLPLVERVAARRQGQHPIAVVGEPRALALADPARLEQLLGHLVQNAIEASAASEPVMIVVVNEGIRMAIDVIDQGCGMTAAFIRDKLFKPFVSSKPGGFGIGAFEARQLALAMGGSVEVMSREGEGTRFRVLLPTPSNVSMERAA